MRILKLRFLVVTLGIIVLTASLPRERGLARDPKYVDILGHWAWKYINTLWEEELTTGYLYYYWAVINDRYQMLSQGYYFPDSYCTRAQFVTMLAKVFRLEPCYPQNPSFRDVPPDYRIFSQTPVYGYIEAAAALHIALGDEAQCFRPDSPITREEAIALLCRSLGLTSYANSLSAEEVSRLLGAFYDAGAVSQCFRRCMAVSIKLKIVEGYPDNTLRPRSNLTRAEAATIIYRSCLFHLKPNPDEFSPDNDGFEDSTLITLTHLKNRNIGGWEVWVEDFSGTRLKLLSRGEGNQAPLQLPWDGTSDYGQLGDGTYLLKGWVKDASGQVFFCPATPVSIRRHTLLATAIPLIVEPGGELRLQAITAPHALNVTVAVQLATGATQITLRRESPTNWTGELIVPTAQADGTLLLDFVAQYPKIRKSATVPVQVFEPLVLTGGIEPNPARCGTQITIYAGCSPTAVRSWALLPWGESVELKRTSSERWEASCQVPAGIEPGTYQVMLSAASHHKQVRIHLDLVIEGSALKRLLFTLTG